MFIAFEGIDGSGKSTQASLLTNYLSNQQKNTILTAEPTKHYIGKLIRTAFVKEIVLQESTIAALFAADRLEHILEPKEGMLAQLQKGCIVICDRYYFSSYAYHSVHVPMQWVLASNSLAAQLLKPTVNFFIDTNPEIAMQRILERNTGVELYETQENLIAVRSNYFKAFELLKDQENIVIINGNQTTEKVFEDVLVALNKL